MSFFVLLVITRLTDDVNLLPVHCTLNAQRLLRSRMVKCRELISLCLMWTMNYFKMPKSFNVATSIWSSSHCLVGNWKNQHKAVCPCTVTKGSWFFFFFQWYCCISDWSSHHVWWGVRLPHQIPSAGWFWCGENELPLSIHGRQVQLQVYHYSGNWL